MSDSIGKIFLEGECAELVKLNYPVDNLRSWAECVESGGDRPVTAGARAVALHVLEVACPGSPILAAMKAGASFEEAVERDRRNREAMSRAAERISEPTEAELEEAVGEIFGGIAEPCTPRCGAERHGHRCDLEAGHAGACCSSREMKATDLFWDGAATARSGS